MDALARRCASSGLTSLSLRLTKPLAGGGGKNLVFSPLSIYSALSVVTAGARGTTLTELLGALGAHSRDTLAKNAREMMMRALPGGVTAPGGPRVAHACGLWHERTLTVKPAFRYAAAASFNAVTRAVDFFNNPEEARKEINSWVATATKNLINEILPRGSVKKNTGVELVVASAIYFNGKWAKPFSKQKTKKDKFQLLDGGGDVEADFMRSDEDQYIAVHDGFKVLKMPYAIGRTDDTASAPARYSMLIFLPDERDGLPRLEDRMAAGGGEGFFREHMPYRRVKVGELKIPKFKLSFGASIKSVLEGLGVEAVFDPSRAELPDVLEEDKLYATDVYHKAVIEVKEEGTEAAAATAIVLGFSASRYPPPRVDFVADHPFVFFVVEESSGAVLFGGHVVDPTKS